MNLAEPQKPKGRGCFFYGCITCLVLLLIAGIGGFIAFRYVVNKVNNYIAQYADTAPATLPRVDLPADEMKQLKARTDAFKTALNAGSNTPPLVLTGREVNALLTNGPSAVELGKHFFITIESNEIKGQVSIPLDEIKIPMIKTQGKYLNGSGG